jgi:hypothetical protein
LGTNTYSWAYISTTGAQTCIERHEAQTVEHTHTQSGRKTQKKRFFPRVVHLNAQGLPIYRTVTSQLQILTHQYSMW